jgi:protoheme ferro-lyase
VIPPIAFVPDYIETLYSTDTLFRKHAAQAGITAHLRVHRFNDLPQVGPMLAVVVESVLEKR